MKKLFSILILSSLFCVINRAQIADDSITVSGNKLIDSGNTNFATIFLTMTNYIPVESPTNFLVYNTTTRVLTGCVTNSNGSGAGFTNNVVFVDNGSTSSAYHVTAGGTTNYMGDYFP